MGKPQVPNRAGRAIFRERLEFENFSFEAFFEDIPNRPRRNRHSI